MNKRYLSLFLLAGLASPVHGQESNPSVGPLSRGDTNTFSAGTEDTLKNMDEYGRPTTQEGMERKDLNREQYSRTDRGPEMHRMHRPMSQRDSVLIQDIQSQIASDDALSERAKNISVDSKNGKVILRGTVANIQEKARLEEIAKKVPGTKSVENQTEVRRY
ncbi:MAG: BON domain-containing protein [Bdellovibrio sp.]